MNFNGAGGLMLLVVAGLWLWVFVPSWVRRSEQKETRRAEIRGLQAEIRANKKHRVSTSQVITKASRIDRLRRTRNLFAGVFTLAMFGIALSLFAQLSTEAKILSSSILLVFAASSAGLALKSAQTLGVLMLEMNKIKRPSTMPTPVAVAVESLSDLRGWVPVDLPSPKQSLVQVEQVEIAEVVQMQPKKVDVNLDEILARRRSNGF